MALTATNNNEIKDASAKTDVEILTINNTTINQMTIRLI